MSRKKKTLKKNKMKDILINSLIIFVLYAFWVILIFPILMLKYFKSEVSWENIKKMCYLMFKGGNK